MASDEPQQSPSPRLSNLHLKGHILKDPNSFRSMRVIGICDRGIYVVPASAERPHIWAAIAVLWDDKTINQALFKTYGKKVRRA